MTYIVVGFLTAMQVVAWFAWFVCEIIIHSLDQDFNRGHYLQILATQSMQLYQYEGIIMAGTLAALHLATSIKTRASRVASFAVQMFGFLAWFWELYFIIPTFYSSSNGNNLFCGATRDQQLRGRGVHLPPGPRRRRLRRHHAVRAGHHTALLVRSDLHRPAPRGRHAQGDHRGGRRGGGHRGRRQPGRLRRHQQPRLHVLVPQPLLRAAVADRLRHLHVLAHRRGVPQRVQHRRQRLVLPLRQLRAAGRLRAVRGTSASSHSRSSSRWPPPHTPPSATTAASRPVRCC